MGLIETEGLILKTYSLAEADKIVVLLTQNEGLVRGVAKGAKRLKSRFGGGLEPFSVINITYFQKEERELVSISHVELIKSYFDAATEPKFLQKFAYLTDLLLEFAPPHDPNENLYRMAKVCLETAALNPSSIDAVGLYFELWILKLGGFLPDWTKCEVCKNLISVNAPSGLQSNYQLICRQCQRASANRSLTTEQRNLFLDAQKKSPTAFVESAVKQTESVREVSAILRRLLSSILGREAIGEKILTANI